MHMLALLALLSFAPQQVEPVRIALAPDASIALEARWEACKRSEYGLFASTPVLREPHPAEARHVYGAAELTPFLPAGEVAVGDTWPVAREAVLPFLRQFHAGARASLHHGFGAYEGAFACLRAASDEGVEILFRAHAEFVLEGGVTYTPAQFEGRLWLERASGKVRALRLALPDRDTNVDVNVPESPVTDAGSLQVPGSADIGWVPRMELVGGETAPPAWSSPSARSISDEDARLRLARRFYPFARLEWLPFEQAVLAQRESGKPLHLVVLFGTLDDESC
ncbi:MAG: hypothetical protein EXS08_14870 [Planctomycetes bacterium]|nr:hypothetical protein [Planctomycetota bacterium]